MNINQIRIKNYITQKQICKELTTEQLESLFFRVAKSRLPYEIEVMKTRSL